MTEPITHNKKGDLINSSISSNSGFEPVPAYRQEKGDDCANNKRTRN